MGENETLRRMMAEGYSRWRPSEEDDAEATRLERYYRNTWLCSACGYRNPLSVNTCPCGDRDNIRKGGSQETS